MFRKITQITTKRKNSHLKKKKKRLYHALRDTQKKNCVNKDATHFNGIKICLRFLSIPIHLIFYSNRRFKFQKQNTKDRNLLLTIYLSETEEWVFFFFTYRKKNFTVKVFIYFCVQCNNLHYNGSL